MIAALTTHRRRLMNNQKKKSDDKKLRDITVKDLQKFIIKVIIWTVIGVAVLMLIEYLVELLG